MEHVRHLLRNGERLVLAEPGIELGVLIFSTLTNVFTQNNLSTSVQAVAKGVIIVIAVLLQQRFTTRPGRSH